MEDILGRIRSGAEKAAFEADKLRRIQGIQGEIRSLNQEVKKQIVLIGRTAFLLYGQEQIDQPQLQAVCKRLTDLQDEISAHEKVIEEIKAQAYGVPVAGDQYGHICPNGHGVLPMQDKFCQVCGAGAVDILPPTVATTCPNCGALLPPEAHFCHSCGQEATSAHESVEAANIGDSEEE